MFRSLEAEAASVHRTMSLVVMVTMCARDNLQHFLLMLELCPVPDVVYYARFSARLICGGLQTVQLKVTPGCESPCMASMMRLVQASEMTGLSFPVETSICRLKRCSPVEQCKGCKMSVIGVRWDTVITIPCIKDCFLFVVGDRLCLVEGGLCMVYGVFLWWRGNRSIIPMLMVMFLEIESIVRLGVPFFFAQMTIR